MKTYLKIVFLSLVFTFAFNAKAQLIYKEGYIITNENDTISGFLADRGEFLNSKMCSFKENKKGELKKYYPEDIKSYRHINGKYYTSIDVFYKKEYTKAFVEVLLDGPVVLYHYWKKNDLSFYIKSEEGKIIGLLDELITFKNNAGNSSNGVYSSNQLYTFEIESYKDTLDQVFLKCDGIDEDIKEVEYEAESLLDITKQYLTCACGKECIHYEKDISVTRSTYGVFTGVQMSQLYFLESEIQSNITSSIPLGIFYNLPLPRISERLSFQVELMHTINNYQQGFTNLPNFYTNIDMNTSSISVPILVKYRIPMKKVSPSIGVGNETSYIYKSKANITPVGDPFGTEYSEIDLDYLRKGFFVHNTQKGGWFVDLGLDYKISPKLFLFSNIRIQTGLNLIIEENNYTNFLFNSAKEKNQLTIYHSNELRNNSATLLLGIRF